ncbi:MAG: Holliday junction branch migration protein RuvA [Anaerolineae bacterium]|nr:Holliday junction branch migration protein RuvA [Anaerolineae bacterium]
MIASLAGTVLSLDEESAVIEAAGIGFRVMLPRRMVRELRVGQQTRCFTHFTVAQSGELSLVGFQRQDELEMFRLLLRVSGVGPKAALALVDSLSLDTIRSAIYNEQPEVLTSVPGIGAKTARRIVFDLRDKVSGVGAALSLASRDDLDLVEALTALGYSVVEAQAAVQSLPTDNRDDFEARLRQALAYFAR